LNEEFVAPHARQGGETVGVAVVRTSGDIGEFTQRGQHSHIYCMRSLDVRTTGRTLTIDFDV